MKWQVKNEKIKKTWDFLHDEEKNVTVCGQFEGYLDDFYL